MLTILDSLYMRRCCRRMMNKGVGCVLNQYRRCKFSACSKIMRFKCEFWQKYESTDNQVVIKLE